MDKIYLNKMEFYGYHGVYPEENKLGQRFIVDMQLELDLRDAGTNDDLDKTINYADAYKLVKEIVEGKPRKLVEAVAEEIQTNLFLKFKSLESTKVRITKPDPPIPGHYESVAIEITRSRNGK